jgi:putative copper export protein/methionine-rich copper-binding protein CopC
MRLARTGALAVAASVLLLPAVLYAHGVLRKSEPANGAMLRVAPRVIRLTFSEPPQLAFTRVELIGPDSQRVTLSPLRVATPDSTAVVVADVLGALRAGRYRITWQITSADGHPVRGTVAFRIAADAAGLAISPMDSAASATLPPLATDTGAPTASAADAAAVFAVDSWQYAVVRLLTFTAIVAVVGAIVFSMIVVPAAHHRVPDLHATFVVDARHLAARAALAATGALALLLAARLVAQSYAVRGAPPDTAFVLDVARTPWGAGFLLSGASLIALAIALARPRQAAWRVAAFGALGLALATSLSGHAAATGAWTVVAVLSNTLHILAAGGWLGALLLVVVAGVPATAALQPLGRGLAVRGMVEVFSPMALAFAGVLAVTGVVAAVLRLGAWSALAGSDYGRLLLLKLGGVVLVLIAGAYNWRRLRPVIDADRVGTLRRTAAAELVLGFLVLAVTAWLVATPPPTDQRTQ